MVVSLRFASVVIVVGILMVSVCLDGAVIVVRGLVNSIDIEGVETSRTGLPMRPGDAIHPTKRKERRRSLAA